MGYIRLYGGLVFYVNIPLGLLAKFIYIVLALFIGLIVAFAGLIFLVVGDEEEKQDAGFITESGTAIVSEQVKRYESLVCLFILFRLFVKPSHSKSRLFS